MSLRKEFGISIGASQSAVRINTDEIPDAMEVISSVCQEYGWELRTWDKAKGLQSQHKKQNRTKKPGGPAGIAGLESDEEVNESAEAALRAFYKEQPTKDENDPDEIIPVVLVLKNFHLCFEGAKRELMVALTQHLVEAGKDEGKFIIGIMPAEARLPPEIDPLFHVIDHELPDEEELALIFKEIVITGEDEEDVQLDEKAKTVAKAALGLTRLQAEGVFAAYAVEWGGKKQKDPKCPTMSAYVWEHKASILNREGLVELHKTSSNFSNVGGLHGFKDYLKRLLSHDPLEKDDSDAGYKGVAAVGPPGVGKSLMAYCVGNEFDVPTLKANPGNLMDQYVGNSEKKTRKFFQICKRMAPVIVVMDEIGQQMPKGGQGDSGVAQRMLGTFLTEMNDIREPIFWFFTSNDTSTLHEAFMRSERIDGKVYVRLPDAAQRADIWKIYLTKFFPRLVAGAEDPRYIELNLNDAIKAYKQIKKVNVVEQAGKFAALLMTLAPEPRTSALTKLRNVDENLATTTEAMIVVDDGWTPAEIRSCCRLSRRLHMTLFDTSKRISHVCLGKKGGKILDRLDQWAIDEGALDAETGELFRPYEEPEDETPEDGDRPRRNKVRRRIRAAK